VVAGDRSFYAFAPASSHQCQHDQVGENPGPRRPWVKRLRGLLRVGKWRSTPGSPEFSSITFSNGEGLLVVVNTKDRFVFGFNCTGLS